MMMEKRAVQILRKKAIVMESQHFFFLVGAGTRVGEAVRVCDKTNNVHCIAFNA
jgi:hypothetical protein